MAKNGITWRGADDMEYAMRDYAVRAEAAVVDALSALAPQVESDAKRMAKWKDRTGNARQGLRASVHAEAKIVGLYLVTLMEYGKWLELKHQGRYAVIMPTLTGYYKRVWDMMRGIFT